MEASAPAVTVSHPKVCVTRTQIMNKSKSATDSAEESRRVVVRSLSVSEPVDIELRRHQRRLEHHEPMLKRHDSPHIMSDLSIEEVSIRKRWNKHAPYKSRGRSRRRFYEPSVERFPPPSVTKSRLRVAQEMPFWRLDSNRFRRTVSSFETREKRDAKWRQSVLQEMPFSHYPWKKIHYLFDKPDVSKSARRCSKQNLKTDFLQMKTKQVPLKCPLEESAQEPRIKLRQRPHSTSEQMSSRVETRVESIADSSSDIHNKQSPSPTLETEIPDAAKPPIAPVANPAMRMSTSTPSANVPLSIRTRIGGYKCQSCERKAYRAESIEALGQVFHNSCFRCAKCSRVLQRGNWNHEEGKFYCNPCHRKLSLLTFRH